MKHSAISAVAIAALSSLASLPAQGASIEQLQAENAALRKEIAALRAAAQAPKQTPAASREAARSAKPDSAREAYAADLGAPVYKAPPAAPFSWSGIYVGGHVGYGWSDSDATVVPSLGLGGDTRTFALSDDAIIGGAQIGFNWHVAPNWLIGIEADISGTGLNSEAFAGLTFGGNPVPVPDGYTLRQEIEWLATVRGRLGYTWDRSLIYVTGGFAWAEMKTEAAVNIANINFRSDFSDTVSGWTIGGGYEWAFAPNWSARVEYLYYDLDALSGTASSPFFIFTTRNTWDNTELHVVRAGVNYRFGDVGKMPVAAKY